MFVKWLYCTNGTGSETIPLKGMASQLCNKALVLFQTRKILCLFRSECPLSVLTGYGAVTINKLDDI
jgi:hypothetical protein